MVPKVAGSRPVSLPKSLNGTFFYYIIKVSGSIPSGPTLKSSIGNTLLGGGYVFGLGVKSVNGLHAGDRPTFTTSFHR